MKKWLTIACLAIATAASGQTLSTYDFPVPLRGTYVPPTPADAFILLSQVGGAYVKSITPAGVATVQLANGTEDTVTLTAGGGGAAVTSGVPDPTGGSDGDAYLQVDASNEIQSIWRNVSGTWTEFTIPTAGTSTDDQTAAEVNTDTANFGNNLSNTDTTVQAALDTLDNLNVGGGGTDDQTAAEVTASTTNFNGVLDAADTTVQAALDSLDDITPGRTLADSAPPAVGAAGVIGVSTDVAREDHTHAGRELSSGTPLNIATTSGTGTSTVVAREDHSHGGFTGPAVRDLLAALTGNARLAASAVRDHAADTIGTNVANFNGLLSGTDLTVQAALNTLDDVTVGAGDITGVTATAPITGGGDTGALTIGISPASTTAAGSMSAADKTKLDGLEEQIELIDSLNNVGYTQADQASLSTRFGAGATVYTADIDADGAADAEINDMIVFQWRDNPAALPDDRQLGIRINDTATTLPIRIIDPLTSALTNKTVADLTRYEFMFLSRQDGVFIQLSTLALSEVMTRVLPGSPTDNQITRYDSGTSAWVAENQVFTGDTDTPANYTGAARYLNRVNAAGNAIEFVPEPDNDNTIPHVSRLPAVADDSPVLVFLTHDEIDGAREDATLVVREALGQYCGYSNGDIFQAFGSISKSSPIEMIFGVWDGTDCTIQTVHSANEGFIDDIRSVIFTVAGSTEMTCQLGNAFQEYGYQTKRITSCAGLEDIGQVDVTINFLYADGTTAYWTDGSQTHRAGLYEKTGTPGVYHDLAPPEDAHRTGEGSAACGDSDPPDAAGQLCVTSDGRGYFAMPRTSLVTTPATISVAGVGSAPFIADIYQTSDLESRNNLNDADFIYIKATQEFYQFQDPDFEVVTWTEAWQYVLDEVGASTFVQTALLSTFLGEFASNNEVILDRDGHTTPLPAQATATVTAGAVTAIEIDYGGSGYMAAPTITIAAPGTGTTATATATITDGVVTAITITDAGSGYAAAPDVTFSNPAGFIEYYFLYSDFGTLIHITEFTNSVRETISEGFAWRGPVIIPEEVLDIVDANPGDSVDEPLDSILVGSQTYSVIVRPGADGSLRDATAADYDSTYARSKVVAVVDGLPYKVRRTLAPGHTASGTFTEVAVNTELAAGGSGTFRWRGVYTADQNVSSPEEDDIYYNIQYHHWRIRDHDPAYGNYWYTLPNGGEILNRLMWVNYYVSETEALGHATANGQRFVLPDGSDWALYTLSAFTAAEGSHYAYSWTEAVPVPVLDANVTLVDDQSLEWDSANKPSVEVEISRPLAESDDGRPIIIDYRPNAAGSESRAPGGSILAEHLRNLTTLRPLALPKVGPGFGGRSAIDRTMDISNSPGSIEFLFPLTSGGFPLRWMRFHYIGDHIDDTDGNFALGATTLTLDSVADIRTGTNYWMVGPVTGAGCSVTMHSEKVTVTAIGDPNPNDITVVRGVDDTDLDDASCVSFSSGADFIEDDKATFTMVPSHDNQDEGDFTFTLLAQGTGAGAGEVEDATKFSTGAPITVTDITTGANPNWVATGLTLPAHETGRWITIRIGKSASLLHLTSEYNDATDGVAGEAFDDAEVWGDTFHVLGDGAGDISWVRLGVTSANELLVQTTTAARVNVGRTIPSISVRLVD